MTARVTITEQDQVATVRLSRPEKRNALDPDMLEALSAAGMALGARRDIRAVVLHGEGKAFSAGLDLTALPKLMQLMQQGGGIIARTHGFGEKQCNLFQHAALVWREIPQPVIAALHGFAFGGAFQIMLGADIRIAAPDCEFSIMEGKWGLVPDMGGIALMRRLARDDVVRRLTYTAEKFDARAAERWGFVTEISDDPLARARELASVIAARSPDAVRAAKQMLTQTEFSSCADTLRAESEVQGGLIGRPNQMEAVMAGMQGRESNTKGDY